MIYIEEITNSPHLNLALEEYCFRHKREHDLIFMLWRNTPSIVVGKFQNTLQEINTDYVREKKIDVVRRISGGGTVFHDLQNLNFTFIANDIDRRGFELKAFTAPIQSALAKMGIHAELTPRNDLRVNGYKICGTAQACIKNRMMFHGCLLFNANLDALTQSLKEPAENILSSGVKSVRSQVVNIHTLLSKSITIDEFAQRIFEEVKSTYPELKPYTFSSIEIEQAQLQAEAKYQTWEWNYAMSPPFTMEKETMCQQQPVKIVVEVKKGAIASICVTLKEKALTLDLQILIGISYRRESVKQKLEQAPLDVWHSLFSAEELSTLIVR